MSLGGKIMLSGESLGDFMPRSKKRVPVAEGG
jgi:hypothetical protein